MKWWHIPTLAWIGGIGVFFILYGIVFSSMGVLAATIVIIGAIMLMGSACTITILEAIEALAKAGLHNDVSEKSRRK